MTSEVPPARNPHVASEHVDVGTAQIDVSHAEIIRPIGARTLAWSLIVLFVMTILIGGANLLFTSSQVRGVRANSAALIQQNAQLKRAIAVQEQQILADCDSDSLVGSLPVTDVPGTPYPSELTVRLVSDFRGAWHGRNCPGKLSPPDPSFVRGAQHYGVPVNS